MTPSPTKIEGVEITSPMAGTFYKAAAPGEAPFVKEGDKVKKGQTVGIIEAMKLMNEIEVGGVASLGAPCRSATPPTTPCACTRVPACIVIMTASWPGGVGW